MIIFQGNKGEAKISREIYLPLVLERKKGGAEGICTLGQLPTEKGKKEVFSFVCSFFFSFGKLLYLYRWEQSFEEAELVQKQSSSQQARCTCPEEAC